MCIMDVKRKVANDEDAEPGAFPRQERVAGMCGRCAHAYEYKLVVVLYQDGHGVVVRCSVFEVVRRMVLGASAWGRYSVLRAKQCLVYVSGTSNESLVRLALTLLLWGLGYACCTSAQQLGIPKSSTSMGKD